MHTYELARGVRIPTIVNDAQAERLYIVQYRGHGLPGTSVSAYQLPKN